MNRKNFIVSSSLLASNGLIHLSFGKFGFIGDIFSDMGLKKLEDEDPMLHKHVLKDFARSEIKNITSDESQKAINTMFWLTVDPNNKMAGSDKRRALNYQQVTRTDIYRACNFKDTYVEDFAINAYDWVWGTGTLALGIFSPPSAAIAIGLFVLEKSATMPVSMQFEAQKEAQRNLCSKTVEKYYISESNIRKFLHDDVVEKVTKIPFKKSTDEIVNNLPQGSKVRKAAEIAKIQQVKPEAIFDAVIRAEHDSFKAEIEKFNAFFATLNNQNSKQAYIENLEFENKERESAIYLSRVLITEVFGNAELGNKFFTLASSLNTIYSTYQKVALSGLTYAATANYVSAGLAILSLFSGKGPGSEMATVFKLFKQLTDIIIKGFNTIHKTQVAILERLQELSEIVIRQGIVTTTQLQTLNKKIDTFRGDYEQDQYAKLEDILNSSKFSINDLFKSDGFNLKKQIFLSRFDGHIGNLARYGTELTASERILSGYTSIVNIQDIVAKFQKSNSFEYLIGTVPVVHRTAASTITIFSPDKFEKKTPNPCELLRAFYIYYQAVMAGGTETSLIKSHIDLFRIKGILVKEFAEQYSANDFIKQVAEQHRLLAQQLSDQLNATFKSELDKGDYYLHNYLLNTTDNEKIDTYKNIKLFIKNADLNNYSFLVTDSFLGDSESFGYTTKTNVLRLLNIFNALGIIEPIQEKKYITGMPSFDGSGPPVIAWPLIYNTIKFKTAGITQLFLKVKTNGYSSVFLFAKDLKEFEDVTHFVKVDFQRTLASSNLTDDHWKVYPGNIPQERYGINKNIAHVDFLKNEAILAEGIIRKKTIDDFIIKEELFYNDNLNLVNQLDTMGYLLASALSSRSFRQQNTSIYSYLERANGLFNVLRPVKTPLTFSRDIFSLFINNVSKDVFNSFYIKSDGEAEIGRFKQNFIFTKSTVPSKAEVSQPNYQILNYVEENIRLKIEDHYNLITNLPSLAPEISNYNIDKLIAETSTYLAKVK